MGTYRHQTNKWIRIIWILYLFLSLILHTSNIQGAIRHEISLSEEDIQLLATNIDENEMSCPTISNGCHWIREEGMTLPIIALHFSVPVNSTNYKIDCNFGQFTQIKLLPPLSYNNEFKHETASDFEDCQNLTTYDTSSAWINSNPTYYGGFIKVISVFIMPFQQRYKPRELNISTKITLDLSWDECYDDKIRLPKCRKGMFNEVQFVKGIVDNPQDVEQNLSSIANTIGNHLDGTHYDYIIVTSKELAPAFMRLAESRRLKGYTSQIMYIEDILSDSRFVKGDTIAGFHDSAGRLRSFIGYAYEEYQTKYVLLGGNASLIPIRYYKYQTPREHLSIDNDIASDLYYALPFDSWHYRDIRISHNLDNDSICYHTVKTVKDFIPCGKYLYVGRVPCKNLKEANDYIDKVLSYEFNPGNGDASYLNNALVVTSATNTEVYKRNNQQDYYNLYSSDKVIEVLQSAGEIGLSGSDIIEVINTGHCGHIDLQGHGNPEGIAVSDGIAGIQGGVLHALDSESVWYPNQPLNGLDCITNRNLYNWMVMAACSVAPLQTMSEYKDLNKLSYTFAESYILGKEYGGVVLFAHSGPTSNIEGCQSINHLFMQLKSDRSNDTPYLEAGRISILSKVPEYHYIDLKQAAVWNLFGDPTINLWMGEPGRIHYADHKIDAGCVDTETMVNLSCMDITDNNVIHNTVTRLQTIGNLTIPTNRICTVASKDLIPEILPATVDGAVFSKKQTIICADIKFGKDDAYTNTPVVTFTDGSNVEIHSTGNVSFINNTEMQNGSRLTIHSPHTVSIKNLVLLRGADLTIYAPGVEMKSGVEFRQGSSFNFIKTAK